MSRVFKSACLPLVCAASLCSSLACDDEAVPVMPSTPTAAALSAAGSGGSVAPATLTQCSLEYASCLAQSPLGLVRCTEEAERCGLFLAATMAGAPAAGAGGAFSTNSPTCALRIAECVVRDPFHAQACQQMVCDVPH